MSPRLKKWLIWSGYPVFYVFALALFAYFTFPYNRLKDRLVAEFNARQPNGDLRLQIDDMSSYWLSGVEAEGVKLVSAAPVGSAGDDGKPAKPKIVTIDSVHARVSLFRWIFGTTLVSFGADAFGGELSGDVKSNNEERTIKLEFDKVGVGNLPLIDSMVGVPLGGALNGTVDLRLPQGKLSAGNGKIDLTVSDLTIGDGKAKIRDTIPLPQVNAGDLVFQAEATDGRLDLTKLTAQGSDFELVADGKIRLRDPFESSLAELNLRFKFNDKYKNKNDMTRGLFGAPGSNVPGVFDLDPKNRRAKRPDGFYSFRLNGPLSRLNPEPAAFGGAGGGLTPRGQRGGLSTRP